MNNKGFTLTELLATIVILSVVVGISLVVVNFNLDKTKDSTEEIFIDTIEDAIEIYISTDGKKLEFNKEPVKELTKSHGEVNLYKSTKDITFKEIISNEYSPLLESDVINPANDSVPCDINAKISIYRDDDYIYYYSVPSSSFNCLKTTENITNLPKENNN